MFTPKEKKDYDSAHRKYRLMLSVSRTYFIDGALNTAADRLVTASECLRDMHKIEQAALMRITGRDKPNELPTSA